MVCLQLTQLLLQMVTVTKLIEPQVPLHPFFQSWQPWKLCINHILKMRQLKLKEVNYRFTPSNLHIWISNSGIPHCLFFSHCPVNSIKSYPGKPHVWKIYNFPLNAFLVFWNHLFSELLRKHSGHCGLLPSTHSSFFLPKKLSVPFKGLRRPWFSGESDAILKCRGWSDWTKGKPILLASD